MNYAHSFFLFHTTSIYLSIYLAIYLSIYLSIFVFHLFCSADVESFKVGLQLCLGPQGGWVLGSPPAPPVREVEPSWPRPRSHPWFWRNKKLPGLISKQRPVPVFCRLLISQVCLSPEREYAQINMHSRCSSRRAAACCGSVSVYLHLLGSHSRFVCKLWFSKWEKLHILINILNAVRFSYLKLHVGCCNSITYIL